MSAKLKIDIQTNAAQAAGDLDKISGSANQMDSKMRKAGQSAGLVGVGLLGLAGKAGELASKLQDSSGAVEAVFKTHSGTIDAAARNAADSVGLSENSYKQMAATLGAQLTNMGTSQQHLAGETQGLIGTAADLAAQFGGPTSDAVAALSSLMRGETDPIERYGISIKQSDIEARKAQLGLKGLTGAQDKAAQKTAIMSLLQEQSASSQGAFAREADNAAVKQQKAAAAIENTGASLGSALLPAMAAAATKASELAGFIQRHNQAFTILAGVLATVVAAVLLYNGVMAIVPVVQGIATAAQWAWNAAMAANPIMLIILAIIALIAIVVVLVKNWDHVKAAAAAAWTGIKAGAAATGAALRAAWNGMKAAGTAVWNAIKAAATAAWNGIKAAVHIALNVIRGYMNTYKAVALAVWNGVKAAATAAWTGIKAAADRVWSAMRSAANTGKAALTQAFNAIKTAGTGFVQPAIDALNRLLGVARSAGQAVSRVLDKAKNLGKKALGAIGLTAAPSGLITHPATFQAAASDWGPTRGHTSTAGIQISQPTNITINVEFSGLVTDPIGTAQQIRRLLTNLDHLVTP